MARSRLAELVKELGADPIDRYSNDVRGLSGHVLKASQKPVPYGVLLAVVKAMARNIANLEAQLEDLSERPVLREASQEKGAVYRKGQLISHDGDLWTCVYKTGTKPGSSRAWSLAVRGGRGSQ